MLINSFSDGAREKYLVFTSNGERKIQLSLPKNAIVKTATAFLESQELPDSSIMRIGVVHNYPLEELHLLEERLEETPPEKYSVRLGWGAGESEPRYGPEERVKERYAVIPIDPSIIVSAHPSYYKQELDMIIIPNGPIHSDLSNLVSSGVPIVTMNPEVAIELGLARRQSLHAGLLTLRAADENHYVTEQVAGEIIRIGLTGTRAGALAMARAHELDLDIRDRSNRAGVSTDHVFVDALEIIPENSRVVVDTGFSDQGVVITDMRNKYAYFGITKVADFIDDENILNLFIRTIEWCAIGGTLVNVGFDVEDEPSGWRKPGFIEERTMTNDFAPLLNRMMEILEPREDGSYLVNLSFYTDSPGILLINDLRIDCSFLTNIQVFEEDLEAKVLEFDSIQQRQETYINLPSRAKILGATLKIKGDLSRERIANRCIDETDVYGVVISSQYLIAQEIVPTQNLNVSRISLHMAKLTTDLEIAFELRPGHPEGQPLDEVIRSKTLTGADLAQTYDWIDLNFRDLTLMQDTPYWILLKAKKGEANWHADVKSPCGGMLRYSKDGGRNWTNHHMDGLFKVFHIMEAYEPSPSFSVAEAANIKWSYTGQFREEYELPDFADDLNSHLLANKDYRAEMCKVPLAFFSESIGTLELSNLLIKCELPTLEMKEELEGVALKEHIKATLDLLEQLKNKLNLVLDGLGPEVLNELVKVKKEK
ncbi:hypothetical protein [[Eubacterium] cellulosolvens]